MSDSTLARSQNISPVIPRFSMTPGNAQAYSIPLGLGEDAPQLVALINALTLQFSQSTYLRQMTLSLFGGDIGNNNQDYQVRILADFVRQHVRFVADPIQGELYTSPIVMTDQIDKQGYTFGDCDDHVLLFNSMCGTIGLNTRAVAVKLYSKDYYDHVISSVNIHGIWKDVDLCQKNGESANYSQRLI